MLVTAFPYLYRGLDAISIWWKNSAKYPILLSLNIASVILTFRISLKNSSISFWKAQAWICSGKHLIGLPLLHLKATKKMQWLHAAIGSKDSAQWGGPSRLQAQENRIADLRHPSSLLGCLCSIIQDTQGPFVSLATDTHSVFALVLFTLYSSHVTLSANMYLTLSPLLLSFITVPRSHCFELTQNNRNTWKFVWAIMADDVKRCQLRWTWHRWQDYPEQHDWQSF